jgi:hypothetical protein
MRIDHFSQCNKPGSGHLGKKKQEDNSVGSWVRLEAFSDPGGEEKNPVCCSC